MIAFCEKSTLEASPQTPKITQKGESLMAKLNRPVQIIFRVTEQEKEQIQERMKMCKIKNMASFLRMMAINGCIINTDYTELKARNYELHKIGVNINQIAKKINETGQIHAKDIKELQKMMDAIWCAQKCILSEEP